MRARYNVQLGIQPNFPKHLGVEFILKHSFSGLTAKILAIALLLVF